MLSDKSSDREGAELFRCGIFCRQEMKRLHAKYGSPITRDGAAEGHLALAPLASTKATVGSVCRTEQVRNRTLDTLGVSVAKCHGA